MIINKNYNTFFIANNSSRIRIILYICSINIRLIIELMDENNENIDEITFKDYYDNLESDEKRIEIRNFFVPKYMSYPTFYNKYNNNSWSEYDFEKLETLTNINFR